MRFTLRELLLLTAVIGLSLRWFLDHRANRTAKQDAAICEKRAGVIAQMLKDTIKCLNAEGIGLKVSPENHVSLERLDVSVPSSK